MYHAAAKTYARNEDLSVHGRIAEGRAFAKAARMLDALLRCPADSSLRAEAVALNRVLWTAVQAEVTAPGCQLPDRLKAGLMSLSLFADRAILRMRVSRDAAPIEALIAVNRDMAGGLLAEIAH